MTKCVECSFFTLRDSPQMAVHGYGNCPFRKAWEYESALKERECARFEQEKEDAVAKRLAWLQKKKGGSNGNTETGRA